MRLPHPCPACGARVLPGAACPRCGHIPSRAHRESETRRARRFGYRRHYTSAEYRRNRARALARSGGVCERCGVSLGPDWECDHIVPVRDGGGDALTNLQCLCRRCALAKTRADRARRRTR